MRDYIRKFSFIENVQYISPHVILKYKYGNKKLPYRIKESIFFKKIEEIKKSIGYDELKKIRDDKVKQQLAEKESVIVYSSGD